jgi:hypothetical protein
MGLDVLFIEEEILDPN